MLPCKFSGRIYFALSVYISIITTILLLLLPPLLLLLPFYGSLGFVWDYADELVPERLNQSAFYSTRDCDWQWHQLGHMQICTSSQTDDHASSPPLSFYRPDALPAAQPSSKGTGYLASIARGRSR